MRTKTLLTGLALAFACTAFGCSDEDRDANVDDSADALALEDKGPPGAEAKPGRGPRERGPRIPGQGGPRDPRDPRGHDDDDDDDDSDSDEDDNAADGGHHHRPRGPRFPHVDGGVPSFPGRGEHHHDGGRPQRPERPEFPGFPGFPGRDGGISIPGFPGRPTAPKAPTAPTAPTGTTGVTGTERS